MLKSYKKLFIILLFSISASALAASTSQIKNSDDIITENTVSVSSTKVLILAGNEDIKTPFDSLMKETAYIPINKISDQIIFEKGLYITDYRAILEKKLMSEYPAAFQNKTINDFFFGALSEHTYSMNGKLSANFFNEIVEGREKYFEVRNYIMNLKMYRLIKLGLQYLCARAFIYQHNIKNAKQTIQELSNIPEYPMLYVIDPPVYFLPRINMPVFNHDFTEGFEKVTSDIEIPIGWRNIGKDAEIIKSSTNEYYPGKPTLKFSAIANNNNKTVIACPLTKGDDNEDNEDNEDSDDNEISEDNAEKTSYKFTKGNPYGLKAIVWIKENTTIPSIDLKLNGKTVQNLAKNITASSSNEGWQVLDLDFTFSYSSTSGIELTFGMDGKSSGNIGFYIADVILSGVDENNDYYSNNPEIDKIYENMKVINTEDEFGNPLYGNYASYGMGENLYYICAGVYPDFINLPDEAQLNIMDYIHSFNITLTTAKPIRYDNTLWSYLKDQFRLMKRDKFLKYRLTMRHPWLLLPKDLTSYKTNYKKTH